MSTSMYTRTSSSLENAFRESHVSVGEVVPGMNRITPAAFRYCELLIKYLTTHPDGTARAEEEVLDLLITDERSVEGYLGRGLPNMATAVQFDIVNMISADLADRAEHSGKVETAGLRMARLAGWENVRYADLVAFEQTLHYGVYRCGMLMDILTVDLVAPQRTGYVSLDLLVSVNDAGEQLHLLNDVELIDGMLVSEAVCHQSANAIENFNYCVCLDGVVLQPNWDSGITLTADHGVRYPGWYRAKPAVALAGSYLDDIEQEGDQEETNDVNGVGSSQQQYYTPEATANQYLLFLYPQFLQGVQNMDKYLKAATPSVSDLQLDDGRQWIAAATVEAREQAPY